MSITNHKCPACTGPLHFVGESGMLECDYCGSKFSVEEIEALYSEKEEQAEKAFEKAEKAESDIPQDWNAEGMKTYNCPSCGASLICDATTAATQCPYCGNNAIVPGQFNMGKRPDFVIPFKLNKEQAIAALKRHYKGKPLLPKEFSDKNHIEEMKGIYVPFWLFDKDISADCTYSAEKVRAYTSGDYEITETKHYLVDLSGSASFRNVPADGSSKMSDDYMDSIEPYDFSELKPFSTAYLPGFLADRYDVSDEDNQERVTKRCEASILSAAENQIIGYSSVNAVKSNIITEKNNAKYVLLPVWTLLTKYNGKNYMFMMNGQTGKLVGDLPVCKKKYWMFFGGITAGILLISLLLGLGNYIVGLLVLLLS